MKDNQNPHDKLIRKVLSNRREALQYIKQYVPKEIVQNLDLRTLQRTPDSYVDEKLKEHFSDLVFECDWKTKNKEEFKIRISFLLEHKSFIPKYPHLQLLRYLLEAWEQDVAEKRSLRVTIPIILYHGKRKWKYRKFEDYFKLPDDFLKKYIPNFEYLLTDLSQLSNEQILELGKSFLANTFLALKYSFDNKLFMENAKVIYTNAEVHLQTEDGKILMDILQIYIFKIFKYDKKSLNLLTQSVSKLVKDFSMSIYDHAVEKGKEEIIRSIILNFPNYSDTEIAKLASVSTSLVVKVRQGLNQSSS